MYNQVISWLLDKTYFIRTEDQADVPALLKKYSKFNLISQDGKWSAMHSVIQGGSIGLFEGKRTGRKQQIEKLEKEVKKGKKRIQELEDHLDELKVQQGKLTHSRLELSLDEFRDKAQQLGQDKVKVTLELEQIQRVSQADADEVRHRGLSDLVKQEELQPCTRVWKSKPDAEVIALQQGVRSRAIGAAKQRDLYMTKPYNAESECERIQGELTLRKTLQSKGRRELMPERKRVFSFNSRSMPLKRIYPSKKMLSKKQ